MLRTKKAFMTLNIWSTLSTKGQWQRRRKTSIKPKRMWRRSCVKGEAFRRSRIATMKTLR